MKKFHPFVRCFDNGGKTLDRYTVLYMLEPENDKRTFAGRGMNSEPFHGIGAMISGSPGPHLGKRIHFEDLPPDCQKVVIQDLNATPDQIDTVVSHYLIACVWADKPEEIKWEPKTPMETYEKAWKDCSEIIAQCEGLFKQVQEAYKTGYGAHPDAGSPEASFGHDIWLTRRGHGSGFNDREELKIAVKEKNRVVLGEDRDGDEYGLSPWLGNALADLVYGTAQKISKWAYAEAEFHRGYLYLS